MLEEKIMESKSGISLIALIITIIVMIILASIVFTGGDIGIDNANETKGKIEISEIRNAITKRFAKYIESDGRYELVGSTLSSEYAIENILLALKNEDSTLDIEATGAGSLKDDVSEIVSRDLEYIRGVDKKALSKLNLNNVSNSFYIVNYKTSKVYGPLEVSE